MVKIVDPRKSPEKPVKRAKVSPAQPPIETPLVTSPEPPTLILPAKPELVSATPELIVPAAPAIIPGGILSPSFRDRIKEDFRLFLTLLWRHLLGEDPNAIQLDIAGYLQHGPERSIVQAARGYGKSWITGGFGLWRLDRKPSENILLVSGSLTRSAATSNWMLALIRSWDLLQWLAPLPHQRSSSKMFDVGPAPESQSASVFSLGIGGQIVGFRGSLIIPDDVETQQNSITVQMRHNISEAVKEFDSVLLPMHYEADGVTLRKDVEQPSIKYLGTPHDRESLYNELSTKRGYDKRIWPGLYPTAEQIERYKGYLAPYIKRRLEKDPSLVGRSTQPERFSDRDLELRRLSLGNSEFALQYMLDTSLADANKYPLRLADLMVASLDIRRGPEIVSWSAEPDNRVGEIDGQNIPLLGFDGDYFHRAKLEPGGTTARWNRVVGALDISGRGSDETALNIVAELNGFLYWLCLWASTDGFGEETLMAIARRCVKFRVQQLYIEENYGGGSFEALLRPVLTAAWAVFNKQLQAAKRRGERTDEEEGGTEIVPFKAGGTMFKEKRILSVMEPVTQQHRLTVSHEVIKYDWESMNAYDSTETKHQYSVFYQFTHLTRDRDSLGHDDRLDSLATCIMQFADIIGVIPEQSAMEAARDRMDAELEKLFEADEELLGHSLGDPRGSSDYSKNRPMSMRHRSR